MKNEETKRARARSETSRNAGAVADAAQGAAAAAQPAIGGKPSKRALRAAERRQAIVDAALVEFSAKGFAAARLEDIAAAAGVGKGTIYLYFKDKEALFQELVRTSIVPLLGQLGPPTGEVTSARAMLERFAEMFIREVYQTRRADIIRLIIAEGARFPTLAEFYYREVVSRGVAGMQMLIQYGISRGEISNPAIIKHPQLVVAPAMIAVIWHGLFGKFAPLDVKAMFDVHIDLIFGPGRAT
jgi:AcrR family transcriptional regulator